MMHGGTIVYASIIAVPSSTKNTEGKRDSEMHQTKKGNQWDFGIIILTGVDAGTQYVHIVTATMANAHDVDETTILVRKDDDVMYGDSGYLRAQDWFKKEDPLPDIECCINK